MVPRRLDHLSTGYQWLPGVRRAAVAITSQTRRRRQTVNEINKYISNLVTNDDMS